MQHSKLSLLFAATISLTVHTSSFSSDIKHKIIIKNGSNGVVSSKSKCLSSSELHCLELWFNDKENVPFGFTMESSWVIHCVRMCGWNSLKSINLKCTGWLQLRLCAIPNAFVQMWHSFMACICSAQHILIAQLVISAYERSVCFIIQINLQRKRKTYS